MNKVPVSQLGLKCSKCKEITQTIEPMKIKKYGKNKYLMTGVCSICQNKKTKMLNKAQRKELAPEITNLKVGEKIKSGGILPIIPLLGLLTGGITALSAVGSAVASNIIQAKKNEAEIELQREALQNGRGRDLQSIAPQGRDLRSIISGGDASDEEVRQMITALGGLGFEFIK